jgi:predicted ribosomally synthesized peptide with nif11-like leader
MSKESALRFLEKLESDMAFKKKLQAAKSDAERKAIQEEANLLFSKEDFKEAYQEKYHKTLSDQELKNIAAAGPSSKGPLQSDFYFSE